MLVVWFFWSGFVFAVPAAYSIDLNIHTFIPYDVKYCVFNNMMCFYLYFAIRLNAIKHETDKPKTQSSNLKLVHKWQLKKQQTNLTKKKYNKSVLFKNLYLAGEERNPLVCLYCSYHFGGSWGFYLICNHYMVGSANQFKLQFIIQIEDWFCHFTLCIKY